MLSSLALDIDINNANIWSSVSVTLFLTGLVTVFIVKWRHEQIPIIQVLTFLLINQILYSACEVLGYIDQENNTLCTISMIGRMAFNVAANFWIIFITRLVYKQALAPGKYYNLVHFVFKNVIFTYIPSLVLSTFLLIIIYISDTKSENKCWRIIVESKLIDYVIYGTTFVLPNLVSSVIIILYLYWLYRLQSRKWTIFLLFPITALVFSAYFIAIKIYQFGSQNLEYLNIFLLAQPIAFGIYYVIIYFKMKKKNNSLINSADITIRGSQGEASFIDDL